MDVKKEKRAPSNEKNSVNEVTRRILKMDGNTLTLCVGFLICLLLCITPIVLSYVISYLLPPENIFFGLFQLASVLVMFGGLIFLSLPTMAGYLNLAKDITCGKEHNFISLFLVYTNSRKYFKAIWYAVLSILFAVLAAFVFIGGFVQLKACINALDSVGGFEIASLVLYWLCSFVAAVLIFAYLTSYLFFVPYVYLDGAKLKDAVRMSVAKSKTCRTQIIKQEFLYLFYLLLGIITLGVVLVIRSVPKISVSYFVLCNSVFDKTPYEERSGI